MTTDTEKLRYPVGPFVKAEPLTPQILAEQIRTIAEFPERLKQEVATLSEEQLDTPYRPGGWTLRQVIHHCADSHLNSFTRFKLALTEERPVIKPYLQDKWAELPDTSRSPVAHSLLLLEGLHARWTALLRSLNPTDLARTYLHPETGREIRLDETIGQYAWHCRHHLAHITEKKKAAHWG